MKIRARANGNTLTLPDSDARRLVETGLFVIVHEPKARAVEADDATDDASDDAPDDAPDGEPSVSGRKSGRTYRRKDLKAEE